MRQHVFLWSICLLWAAFPGSVRAAEPMFSLEATEVNGAPLADGASSQIRVGPGDIVTAQILLRDWSPDGQRLRSYQATLDPDSYASGDGGTIQPVALGEGPENPQNAFIDETHPRFIHRGKHIFPIVDVTSPGYRWMGVLFNEKDSMTSPQDGSKFYCGTVRLKVSADASGVFEMKITEDPTLTLIVDPSNTPIVGLATEPLLIDVVPAGDWLRIQESDPPNGAVDARAAKGAACAWQSIRVSSTGDAAGLKREDFVVDDGTNQPPRIREMQPNGSTVELIFDRGISPGRWTRVVHPASGSSARISCLPGDVNNDAVIDGRDVLALLETLNGRAKRPIYQTDINADGTLDARDLTRLIDLLESARAEGRTRIGRQR